MVFKKILLTLTLCLTLFAFANEENNGTDIIVEQIDQGDKIMMLYVDDNACQYCRKLDVMLQEGKAGELIQEHFIIKRVMFNENLYLPEGLPVPFGTPTVYFLDANESALIEPMRGKKTKEDLIFFLEEAIKENNKLLGKKSSFLDQLLGK